jgi:hypothetical protein
MAKLEQWNKLVDKNWEYWEYYKDLYDYALSKGANTALTKPLYPKFYQQRLIKREFVNNMQLLGELKPEEIEEYSKLTKQPYLDRVYKFHSKPSGKIPFVLFPPAIACTGVTMLLLIGATKSISWHFMAPLLTFVTVNMLGIQLYKLRIGNLVDCTQWALQKRKAEVWLEEKKHPTSKIASIPSLKYQILEIVRANKP